MLSQGLGISSKLYRSPHMPTKEEIEANYLRFTLLHVPILISTLILISLPKPFVQLLFFQTGKLGTGFGLVKSDVGGNIDRLATRAATLPDLYNPDIFQIIRDEVTKGTHTESTSCTKGLLWLKRAMQFVVALLHRLAKDRNISLSEAASETYYSTLQQYHGWIVTGTFTVALKLVPGRESFFESVGAGGADGNNGREAVFQSMNEFCVEFEGLLEVMHKFFVENDLDDPTKV